MTTDAYAAIDGADAVAIVTEWDAFRALDLARVKYLAKAPVLVDLRNIYRPDDVRAAGFDYVASGAVRRRPAPGATHAERWESQVDEAPNIRGVGQC